MSGKRIIITGASSGIGEALAREFASKGCALGLLARRTDRLDALATELRKTHNVQVVTAALDVTADETIGPVIDQVVSQLGGLDVVIANAGIVDINKTGSGDISKDKRVMQTNYIGAIATLDAGARHFRAQKRGQLVGISSIAAWLPIPGSGSYTASKAALTAWLNSARVELARHNIKVTSVHPGFIRTEFAANMEKYPFLIEADEAARAIVKGILAEEESLIVPRWPWALLMPVLGKLPKSIVNRIF